MDRLVFIDRCQVDRPQRLDARFQSCNGFAGLRTVFHRLAPGLGSLDGQFIGFPEAVPGFIPGLFQPFDPGLCLGNFCLQGTDPGRLRLKGVKKPGLTGLEGFALNIELAHLLG